MPMMDGFQLAQNLLQKDLNVRICFMTAGEINMDAAREVHPLKSIGCFIKKPITAEQLLYIHLLYTVAYFNLSILSEKVVSGTNMTTTISFDNLEIDVPRAQGPDGRDLGGATWKLNGKVVWTTEAHKAQNQ